MHACRTYHVYQCRELRQIAYAFGRSPIYDTFITVRCTVRRCVLIEYCCTVSRAIATRSTDLWRV
jgi:hypothetical protein